jgi:hypothetical protein
MNVPLQLRHDAARGCLDILMASGRVLWHYVYAPETPANESPRPYAHPLYTLAGDPLTNFRPNDHPWHHGLSLTLANVSGVNFWGGPTHAAADGYQWRGDHGAQTHHLWSTLSAGLLEQEVHWYDLKTVSVLLQERRRMSTTLLDNGWSLRWTSDLLNVSGRELTLGNYHALGGLAGSHYTGLQFRGARDLLDEHGDASVGIQAEGGLSGEAAVHGVESTWMEWHCQHDTSLRRTRIRFENLGGPLPWFVRRGNPLAAFAFHREQPRLLAAGDILKLDHRLTFLSV